MKIGLFGISLLATLASSASAIELHQIEFKTGTDGLRRAFLNVHNDSEQDLTCHANLAHWYSLDVLSIEPTETGVVELWFDPATGASILLNEKLENMPVEMLWCGIKGRAYVTRSALSLDVGDALVPRAVNCAVRSKSVFCE